VKKIIRSLILAAAALAVFVPLSITASAAELNCRVPFSFVVNGATLPAGAYTISTTNGALLVRGAQKSAFAMSNPAVKEADRSGHGSVVFLKTGDTYHLIEIWSSDGNGREVRLSPREAEERARATAKGERIIVAAK